MESQLNLVVEEEEEEVREVCEEGREGCVVYLLLQVLDGLAGLGIEEHVHGDFAGCLELDLQLQSVTCRCRCSRATL